MQQDDLGFCPSFSCYSSDNLSSAAGRISNQLQQQQHAAIFPDEDEFDFSFAPGEKEFPAEDVTVTDFTNFADFPLFNRDILIQNEVDRENSKIHEGREKLFITGGELAYSSSDESDGVAEPPPVLCVWRNKIDSSGSSSVGKCKKSNSTGSGSKRWRIRDLLRRSNSEGKEPPVVLLSNKKVEIPKQRRIVTGKLKSSSPSIHEEVYVKQRGEGEGGRWKSYLPYRQGLVGCFINVNGSGKKLEFY